MQTAGCDIIPSDAPRGGYGAQAPHGDAGTVGKAWRREKQRSTVPAAAGWDPKRAAGQSAFCARCSVRSGRVVNLRRGDKAASRPVSHLKPQTQPLCFRERGSRRKAPRTPDRRTEGMAESRQAMRECSRNGMVE